MSDLISREDVIKHIKAYRDEFKEDFDVDSEEGDDASHHFGYIAGLNRATRIIERLPSAEPQDGSDCPLHKRWGIECDDGYSACAIVQRLKGEEDFNG